MLPTLLLALSFANLSLVVIALVRHDNDTSTEIAEPALPRTDFFGTLALAVLFTGQLLYLVLVAAWHQHWLRFYPGNPIQTYSVIAGILLSVSAFLFASVGTGLKRLAGMIVAVTTGFFGYCGNCVRRCLEVFWRIKSSATDVRGFATSSTLLSLI